MSEASHNLTNKVRLCERSEPTNKVRLCERSEPQSNRLLDEAANAEKAGLAEVRVKHPSYDFNTLNEMAQMKH